MKPIRRHLSYANIIATLALLFAMSGGALAAKHYLINSTKQINPKVLKKLKGNTGKTGKAGATGSTGPVGATGEQGSKGAEGPAGQSALLPLPSGQSESGDYGIRTPGGKATELLDLSVTFPIRLAAEVPSSKVVYTTVETPVTHCSGPGHADSGFLCIYSGNRAGVTPPEVGDFERTPLKEGTGRLGFDMEWELTSGDAFDIGSYTVTAP